MANPLLLQPRPLPFDQILPEHVEPAIHQLLSEANAELDAIAGTAAPLTYDSTFGRLEDATFRLNVAMSMVEHFESVQTSPAFREAYGAIVPKVSEFWSGVSLHAGLYRALREFGESPAVHALSPVKARLVEKTLADFRRNGADLDEAGKSELRKLDAELSQLTTKFSQNVLDGTNAYSLVVDESRLSGLPQSAITMAKEGAEAQGAQGFRFTLQAPSVTAVLSYADDRSLREEIWKAYSARGRVVGNNLEIVHSILTLRQRKAQLLGFQDFADFVTVDRMAGTGEKAHAFIADLTVRTEAAFARETETLKAFRASLVGDSEGPMQPWDVGYYAEKQRKALYDFDEEQLRPYLSAERVLEGAFSLAETLFGVRMVRANLPVWHESVQSYTVLGPTGATLGVFYTDLYPRASKRDGAWMHGLVAAVPPAQHVALFCANAQPPTQDAPSLLSFRDTETVFHEFGHLLHHLLSEVEVRSLACTNVAQDFVELPSQILENWCSEKAALDRFARHYQTNAPIPEELVARLLSARRYRAASAQMRQLGFAAVDLALHREAIPKTPEALNEWAETILRRYSVCEAPPSASMIASFGHLFSSPIGYAAGYYSYKWAEVLDADAFTKFKQMGIWNPEAGALFRQTVLARGDSAPPQELFRNFMGRDPELGALLERLGLTEGEAAE